MSLMLLVLLVMLKILVNMKIYKKISIIRVHYDYGLSLKLFSSLHVITNSLTFRSSLFKGWKYFLSGSGKVVGLVWDRKIKPTKLCWSFNRDLSFAKKKKKKISSQYLLLRQSADKAIERFPSNQTTLPLNLRLYRAFFFIRMCLWSN